MARFPGSQTERAETIEVARQQHAHIWLNLNNTLLGILHVMLRDSKQPRTTLNSFNRDGEEISPWLLGSLFWRAPRAEDRLCAFTTSGKLTQRAAERSGARSVDTSPY